MMSMVDEMKKFLITIGLFLLALLFILRFQFIQFKHLKEENLADLSLFEISLDLFNGLTANQDFASYRTAGQIFVGAYAYTFFFLLLSFLVAIFVNRYKEIWGNIEAVRRMDIIQQKNSLSFDPMIRGVTMTFFPINILLLPFIIVVVGFRSSRVSDLILKVQYAIMIVIYCFFGALIAIPVCPLLLLKAIVN